MLKLKKSKYLTRLIECLKAFKHSAASRKLKVESGKYKVKSELKPQNKKNILT